MSHEMPLDELLREDPRYQLQAYLFVKDALQYAQQVMGLGKDVDDAGAARGESERHVTAQELCEAARRYALEEYGLMARIVLKQWGLESTSDLGNVVFNLIRIQLMKKSQRDRREDFDHVYDFHEAFDKSFRITPPPTDQKMADDE